MGILVFRYVDWYLIEWLCIYVFIFNNKIVFVNIIVNMVSLNM